MSSSDVLFQGKIFRVERTTQVAADGSEHPRQVVRHPGAVVILPVLDDGRICLLRNFRAAVDETLIELPAGTLEPGEEPQQTALRELAEETGYRADRIERLLSFYMSPGILDERMHLFLADRLHPGPSAPEPGERIEPLPCTWEEAMEMIRGGEIRDSKTLVGLLYYKVLRLSTTGG